jgi:hypothetical protein
LRKLNQIGGKTYPNEDFPEKERKLKGFIWRNDERPRSVEDLFADDPPLNLPKIKGLDAYNPQDEFFDEDLLNRIEKAETQKDDAAQNKQPKAKTLKRPNKAARNVPPEKLKSTRKIKPVKEKVYKSKISKKQN